ncbi:MAG: trigger factor [Vicinamibacterales bacterium]
MKTEFVDVSETQKTLTIEIPSDVVDAEINRVASGYKKQARIPGFRPGKVPATLIKQRFKDQIRHDVMHGLIPRAVEEALQERGIEPVDTPDIKEVALEEGRPLTFTAAIETVPIFDPGDLSQITLSKPIVDITDDAVERTLQQIRERAAKYATVEGRPAAAGDAVVARMSRTDPDGETDHHDSVSLEIGSPSNPPGFDENLIGLSPGDTKRFSIHFPEDYEVAAVANTDLTYEVEVKEVRHKSLPDLDDEFAKEIGEFETVAAMRERIRTDMEADAEEHAKRHVRTDLMKELAGRLTFELPAALLEREMDRRVEELARRMMSQKVDPQSSGIDWAKFRESQRDGAKEAVAGALVLDEVARREHITVTGEDVDKEIGQYAERSGRTPEAVRAQFEKEGGISRLHAGLRREKAVDLAMSRATITTVPHEHH